MTLYRNGAAEALSAFNSSVAWYGQSKDQERQHFLSVALLASLLCPLVWLLLLLVLVCPLLYVLERRRRQIWTDALNQSREMEKQRKKSIHKADFPAKKDTIKTYESSKTMKMLIIASLLYCCFSSLSSLGLCQYGYRSLNPVLESKPGYVDWLGMRRAVTAKGWFHMREAWLPSNVSFPALFPDLDPFYSPVLHWEGANALLLTLQRCLMFGCSTEPIYLSNAHRNLLMDRSPTAVDTPMQAGLTPFLHEIVQLSSAARADLKIDPKTDYSKGKRLEKYYSLAFTALTQSNQMFDSDTAAQLRATSDQLEWFGLVLVCVSFLLLFGELPLVCIVSSRQVLRRHCREIEAIAIWGNGAFQPVSSSNSV